MPIILGRPFMAIGRAMVDMEKWEIKFKLNDGEVIFKIRRTMKKIINMRVV